MKVMVMKVRCVNQKRFITEERLQQFGRELRSSITKDVTQSVMESIQFQGDITLKDMWYHLAFQSDIT